jgi:hypothetical protein
MKRKLWLLSGLALTACTTVIYVTPSPAGELLPEQIQRAAAAYTATARVMATQAALATSAGISARETSTAVAQSTLQLTAGVGEALATDVVGAKTQAAAQTSAWATPT